MISADLVIANCNQLLTCSGSEPKKKESLQNVGLVENSCIASYKGKIVFVGKEQRLKKEIQIEKNADRKSVV